MGVILSFGITFIGFVIRYFNKKLDTKIEVRIGAIDLTLQKNAESVESLLQVKEEVDRERFIGLKDQVSKIDGNTTEINKKLDTHLVDAAEFVGSTKTRLTNIEQKARNNVSKSNT